MAPALGGYGAVTMANALKKTVTTLPAHLKQSLTWDRGKTSDMPGSRLSRVKGSSSLIPRGHGGAARTKTRMASCDGTSPKAPTCPDGRPGDPCGANALNTSWARKTLGWRTPAEALNEYLRISQQPSVATSVESLVASYDSGTS